MAEGEGVAVVSIGGGRSPFAASRDAQRAAYLHDKVAMGMEGIIRSFTSVESYPKPRKVIEPPKELEGPATIRWGKKASFKVGNFKAEAGNASQRVYSTVSDDPTDPEPLKRLRISYSEEGRKWEDIRVTNADDLDAYIVVREAATVAVDAGGNGQFLLEMGTDSAGEFLARGQDPAPPPPLEKLNENQNWLAWAGRHNVSP